MKSNILKSLCSASLFLIYASTGTARQERTSSAADSSKAEKKVHVAYDVIDKKQTTYSISTVSGNELSGNSVYLSGNSLYGKLPGLTVLQRTSEPGSDAPAFYLRGRSTTKTTTPLVIVDGIERDINDVQLEDIESVSVLKDAASSVIYGIRGANGVILVTTRRGSQSPLRVNANVQQSLMSPTRIPEFYNSADFVKLYNQASINDGLPAFYSQQQIAGYESGDRYYYPDVDWRKEVTKDFATGTKANVNVSGGEKAAKYYASLGYFRQGGIYKNTDMNDGYSTNLDLDNVSFRSNLDLNINENWSFGLDLSGRVYQKNSPVQATSTAWDNIYKYPAHLFPVQVQDGIYGGTAVYPSNPVGFVNGRGYRLRNNRAIMSTLFTNYNFGDLVKGLNAGLKFSTDNFYANEEGYTKNFAVREVLGADASGNPVLSNPTGTNTNLTPLNNTTASRGYPLNDVQNKRNTFEGNIQYLPQVGPNHYLNTQLIYHQDRLIIGSESPYNHQFLAGRVNYGYRGKYFAELAASYSGTEAFPEGHRFGFFPAASAAWIVSEESFLKGSKVIGFLKFRVSAGIVGNSAVGERFSNMRQYTASDDGYNFGNANASQAGLYSGVLPNSGFTWETAHKYDLGIDSRLFKALDLSLTYFFQKRSDILVPENNILPSTIGADLPNINAGITHNSGFEGSLSYVKDKGRWGYRVGFNASYVTDKIKYFPEATQPYDYLYRTGNRINQPFMLEAVGFFNSQAEIQNSPFQTFGTVKPGDIKYKDQNGDNIIDAFDEIPLQNSTLPKWDMGLDFGFKLGRFDFNAFLQGQLGRSLYLGSEPILFWPLVNNNGRISTYATQFWTEQTKSTADYPRLTTQENSNNYRESSFWYVNGDFLRLRSVDIGYNLPKSLIDRIKLSQARFFLRGMNLLTVDHLKYTDPEVMSGYPVMKSYNAGISLQF
ncbi:MAG: TonB-dependent receptor [Sphingobacteriaceae bacterium]|nr:TonB-dependent receptor [Sphingobacteriaceae bacterium]